MQCLFVSDLHYALKQLDWVVQRAGNVDVVVLGGDHLDISSNVDARIQITVSLKYFRRLQSRAQVVVSSGNHDLDALDASGEKVTTWLAKAAKFGVHTDWDSFAVDGTLFTVCPWWDGPQVRERVGELLAHDAGKPKDRWVWVYHSPPSASPTSWGGKQDFGDEALVEWIHAYAPDIVLAGHIHQSPFVKDGSWVDRIGSTWVFNPGRQIGPSPAHILLNLEARAALWFSLAGEEIVNLAEPLTRPVAPLTEPPAWIK